MASSITLKKTILVGFVFFPLAMAKTTTIHGIDWVHETTTGASGCTNCTNVADKLMQTLCEIQSSTSLTTNHFSLQVEREGKGCRATPKWKDKPLNGAQVKCMNLTLQWEPATDISADSLSSSALPATATLLFQGKKIPDQKKTCKKEELKLEELNIVLSDPLDQADDSEEKDDKNEEDDDEEKSNDDDSAQKLPRYAGCEWKIYKGDRQVSLADLKSDGFEHKLENKDDIDCEINNRSGNYDCTHEIGETKHTVTLIVSKDGKEKRSTCDIPSQQQLLQDRLDTGGRLPVTPIRPPRLIRYNFRGPILSPGVW